MKQVSKLEKLLDLRRPPVAVKFQSSAPEGVDRVERPELSGCTYWKLASRGRTFYTEASDHYGCPIGAHTHAVRLPEDKAKELEGLVGTMVQLEYISMDEVPEIPQRSEPFEVAVYAPLSDATFEPDAVLVTGNARQLMLLAEAAHSAGVQNEGSVVGRPTCAAIPAVMRSGGSASNLGCIGNRVYTEIDDDELYFVFSGDRLDQITDRLVTIVHANQELEAFHRGRESA